MKGLLKPIAAATLIGLTACGAEKTSQEYYESANQYLNDGNSKAAVIELKNALRQSGENIQARILLGDIYYDQGSFSLSTKEYEKALQAGADINALVPKLALAYYKTSDKDAITKLVDTYPDLGSEPGATLSAIQALSLINQGDFESANDYLAVAEQKQADNIYARLGKASLSLTQSTPESQTETVALAEQAADEILRLAPKNIEANLLKGHLLSAQGKHEQAEEHFIKVMTLAPQAPQYAMYLIQSQMRQKKFDLAEPNIDRLLTAAASHPILNEFKARVLYAKQEFSEARKYAEIAIQNGSTSPTSFVIAGIGAIKANQLEQSYRHLSRVQRLLPDDHMVSRLYAFLQLQLGYVDEAVETLDNLQDLKETDAALFASATAQLAKSGNDEKALDFAQKAAELDQSGANSVKLGVLKLATEDQSGLNDLEDALETNPNLTEARLAIIYSLLADGETEQAVQESDEMLAAAPNDPRSHIMRGLVERHLRQPEKALQSLDKALALAPTDAIALLSKANILFEQGDEPQAFELQKQNIKANPDKPYIVRAFMAQAFRFSHIDDAAEVVSALLKEHGSSRYLNWAQATILAVQNKQSEAIDLLSKLSSDQHIPLTRQLLGDLYLQTREYDKAESTYEAWRESQPGAPKIYLRLITANELQKDFSQALNYAEKAVSLFPESQTFKLLEATMLFEKGQVRESALALEDLNETAVEHPVAIRLKARIALNRKEYAKGLELWKAYYEKDPSVTALVGLADVYNLNNQTEKGIAQLEAELDKFPKKVPGYLRLGQHYLTKDPQKALTHFESAISEEPSNMSALNNAAWLLLELNQLEKAKTYAAKAYELSNAHPLIADTYALILMRMGEAKSSLPIFEKAYQAASNNNEVALHYAENLIALGSKVKASQILDNTNPQSEALKAQKMKLMEKL